MRQPLPPSQQAITEAWSADPGEMAAAAFEFWLFVFAMGSSPVAWLITAGFQSVTPAMWAEFLPWVVVTFGSLFKGLSVIACAAFAGTYGPPPSTASPRLARAHARATAGSQHIPPRRYWIHGLLMLPLDLYATPDALEKLMVVKVQSKKRVDPSKLPKAVLNMMGNLVFVAFPIVTGLVYGSLNSDHFLRVDETLPSHKERCLCLASVIIGNEVRSHPRRALPCSSRTTRWPHRLVSSPDSSPSPPPFPQILFFYSHWALHTKTLYARIHKARAKPLPLLDKGARATQRALCCSPLALQRTVPPSRSTTSSPRPSRSSQSTATRSSLCSPTSCRSAPG